MLQHYRRFAAYNSWANALVYAAAADLPDEDYRRDLGAFFPSVHATLNHVLYADGVWMTRFAGQDTGPVLLDTILFEDFQMLKAAREEMDRNVIGFIDGLDSVEGTFSYYRGNPPKSHTDRLGATLAHVFNHQTHHRGQVHAMLTAGGHAAPVSDLAFMPEDA